MHIFIINLEKDTSRRESIVGQLEALGLTYEIIPAVYGAALSNEDRLRHYDDRKAKWRQSRSLVSAEIGCALSHLNVYRMMIERVVEYALVLEDDVTLPSNLKSFLDCCVKYLESNKPTVWLLSPAAGRKTNTPPLSIDTTHSLLPYQSGYYTSSYLLTLPAARALVKELYPVGDVADCWHRMDRYRVVDLYVVSPPLIEQEQDKFGSSTSPDIHKATRNATLFWLTYKPRRLRAIVIDLFYARYRRWFRPHSGINIKRTE